MAKLKTVTDKPVCVGFGISKEEQAQQVVRWGADGVIVGSALVKRSAKPASPEEGLARPTRPPRSCARGPTATAPRRPARGGGFFANLFGKK